MSIKKDLFKKINLEEIAKYCVQYIWKKKEFPENTLKLLKSFNGKANLKFCSFNVILLIRNDEILGPKISKIDSSYKDKLWILVDLYIKNSEEKLFHTRRQRTPEDPFLYLKSEIKGKNWKEAKFFLSRLMPASFLFPDDYTATNESIEHDFQRFINVNSYGTYLDLEFIRKTSIFFDPFGNKVIKRLGEVCEEAKLDKNNRTQVEIYESLFKNCEIDINSKIKVYRGTSNPHAKIRFGDFVTPDMDYARDYIRGPSGVIIESEIFLRDLIVSKKPFEFKSIELIYYPKTFETLVKRKGLEHFKLANIGSFKELHNDTNSIEK